MTFGLALHFFLYKSAGLCCTGDFPTIFVALPLFSVWFSERLANKLAVTNQFFNKFFVF